MKSSLILLKKIKEFEGLRLRAYQCSAGVWTIGYGHTRGVSAGQRCSVADAERWLREDVASCEAYVRETVRLDRQGAFDAVVDFVFNVGRQRFARSTLLKKIRAGAPSAEIQREFRRWVYADGRVLAGLKRRREWEAGRWLE